MSLIQLATTGIATFISWVTRNMKCNKTENSHSKILMNIALLNNSINKSLEDKMLTSITIDHTLNSRLILYEQLHIKRVLELLKGISICAEHHLALPTILSARALLETVAVFTGFYSDFEKDLKNKDFDKAFDVISRYLRMTKDEYLKNSLPEEAREGLDAVNVLTQINKLNKFNPQAIKSYENLSEKCHPNYGGLFQLYAALNEENNVISFAETEKHLNEILNAMIEIKENGNPFYTLLNSIYDLMRDHADKLEGYYNNFLHR